MDQETKKFLYGSDNGDHSHYDPKNINYSHRTTDYSGHHEITSSPLNKPQYNYVGKQADLSPFLGGQRRTFMERTFGPMEQGSIRGSIFALCAVAIGAGVLSLPYVLKMSGWVLGTLLIIIGAVSGYYSMYMILVRSIETNCKNFSELAMKAGGKGLTILLQISILSFMFGACVSYQIISKFIILLTLVVTKLFVICCNNFGVSPDITGTPGGGDVTLFKVLQTVGTTVLFIFPLSLAKSMSALRYVSLVSIGAIIYTLIVMLVELPRYYDYFHNTLHEQISYFALNLDFFNGCSITFFSFTCQASILPIFSELVNPNEKRMMKVIGRSLLIDCLFYCAIALVGYFSTLESTPDLVIARPQIDGKDYFMTVSCLAVILVVLVSSPANYFPFKNTLNYMITDKLEVSHKM